MMKPFDFIKEREPNELIVDFDFTASLETVQLGRYDNESPPLIEYIINNN